MTKYVYSVDVESKGLFGMKTSTRLKLFNNKGEANKYAKQIKKEHPEYKIEIEKIDTREFGPHPF